MLRDKYLVEEGDTGVRIDRCNHHVSVIPATMHPRLDQHQSTSVVQWRHGQIRYQNLLRLRIRLKSGVLIR